MDLFERIANAGTPETRVISTVDMHTCGEATRIILPGQVPLVGATLLEKRACAAATADVDGVRKMLMREPRGHAEMYGAFVVPDTELTRAGEADVGVLFCHNEGYSTMCGHATLALGRFLLDTDDVSVWPRGKHLEYDEEQRETRVRLHAPCGVVDVSVPTVVRVEGGKEVSRSDGARAVRFESVPSFASALGVVVEVPEAQRWPQLRAAGRTSVVVDVAFGGAYYAIVSAAELGFVHGARAYSLAELDAAAATVKALLAPRRELFAHPSERALEYLYGVIVVEHLGKRRELGVCFFADQQVDRSPTGSGVCARVALGVAKRELRLAEEVTYESLVSIDAGDGAFTGVALLAAGAVDRPLVVVGVTGRGYYTGAHRWVLEAGRDPVGEGIEVR